VLRKKEEVSVPLATFGPDEFQLMLLWRMADFQPGLVEDAAGSLGVPRAAVAAAHRRWQAMLRSHRFPGGSRRYELVLGRPRAAFERQVGELTTEVTRWALPLWPDLRYEIITVPGGGPVLQEWLVRPDPGTAPKLRTVADLRPWGAVIGDLAGVFADPQHADDGAPSRWAVTFTAADEAGVPRRHLARFVWGLLQTTTVLQEDRL
jgi:hypothetical protein